MVALFPIFLLALYTSKGAQDNALSLTEDNLQAAAKLGAANLDKMLEGVEQLLTAITGAPDLVSADRARCERYFTGLRGLHPAYVNVGMLTKDGRQNCLAVYGTAPLDANDRLYFREAIDTRRFGISEYIVVHTTGKATLPTSQPILGKDGVIIGVTYASITMEAIEAAISQVQLAEGAAITVLDRNGTVLARHANNNDRAVASWRPGERLHEPDVLAALKEKRSGVLRGDEKSDPHIHALTRLRPDEPGALTIVTRLPHAIALRHTRQAIYLQLEVLSIVSLLGIAAAWFAGNRYIVKPASRLLDMANLIAGGDLGARMQVSKGSRSERSRLGLAFNTMVEAMQTRQDELDQSLTTSRCKQDLFESVLESMVEAIVVVDAEGRFLLLNLPAQRILGTNGADKRVQDWPEVMECYEADDDNIEGKTPIPAE
ncbi:MAG: PAS domain-containing protein [Candidatus Protistobacter heckmanni]|nr:PAS domain-containing protein [Candidatus Protistobacter heckmanni]